MPQGSRRQAWLLRKDAEAEARAAAEAGRGAAGGGTAVSPGFGPAVLTVLSALSPVPCLVFHYAQSCCQDFLRCPLTSALAFLYFLWPGPPTPPGRGPQP